MNYADAINGLYEFIGGIFLLLNCFKLYQDKKIRGITLSASTFFATWSWWNLYYYPSLDQWFSFTGALFIAATNTTWLLMAFYYSRKENNS